MRLSQRQTLSILLAPALAILGILFLGGLIAGLLRSFNYFPLIGLNNPSLDAYKEIFKNEDFLRSLGLSLYIAFSSTLISTVIAVAVALLLRKAFVGKKAILFFFQFNITIPHLVGAIGIMYLFSQSGIFARVANELGLISQPADFPAMIFDPAAIGIILQYVWKEIPFIGIVALAMLQSISDDYESVASSLGASRWQIFRYVILPMIAPGVLGASVIVFAFTFGAYEIPALLGEHYPAALPVLAYRMYTDVDLSLRPQAMAMAMIITVFSIMAILAYLSITRRYLGRK